MNPQNSFFASLQALIIAAGASSRMGQDKAKVRVHGRSNFERILHCCSKFPLQKPLVLVRGCYRDNPAPQSKLRLIINEQWEQGRTGSIQCALKAAPSPFTLLWPIDIPFVQSATLAALFKACQNSERGVDLWIPSHQNRRGHPIIFTKKFGARLLKIGADQSMRRLFDGAHIQHVTVDDPAIRWDINDRATLEQLLRSGALKKGQH
jgi:molybdenum cofactor cytidylyltransferase